MSVGRDYAIETAASTVRPHEVAAAPSGAVWTYHAITRKCVAILTIGGGSDFAAYAVDLPDGAAHAQAGAHSGSSPKIDEHVARAIFGGAIEHLELHGLRWRR